MQMNTATALESMTDRSRFELLATSILRKISPNYSAIIHTGINAQGETIVSPVDGLHLIPNSSPPHYVFVQHTTTDRKTLRAKWLSLPNSDLPKAVGQAKMVHESQADAVFTVVLTTNQRLDQDFILDVYKQAEAGGVSVDILEQSRCADFLDSTEDGHWLRKVYLGIEAERLSEELLRILGWRSYELYLQEFLPPSHAPLVRRSQVESILSAGQVGGPGLCLLTGPSGCGKSVIAAQCLAEWLSRGRLGLWLPERYLQSEADICAALGVWLRSLHPSLQPHCGTVAMETASRTGRLLVCVDDINRTPDVTRLLRTAVSYAASAARDAATVSEGEFQSKLSDSLFEVIPVWPDQLHSLHAIELGRPWIQLTDIGRMDPHECSCVIGGKLPHLTGHEVNEYADTLNRDPFLVGLFAATADDSMTAAQLRRAADDAIGGFLTCQFRELSASRAVDLLPTELSTLLSDVSRQMIRRRTLRPTWNSLSDWFGAESRELRGLRALVQQGHVCRIDADEQIDFRHDRLRERYFVRVMTEFLTAPAPLDDAITDPYFSESVGKAFANTEVQSDRITTIATHAPWVIFDAIRHIGEPRNDLHIEVFAQALAWATKHSGTAKPSVLTAICWSLVETDSSYVVPIVDALKSNRLSLAAGLRNGSADHGMQFLRRTVRRDFEPGFGDSLRDKVIEQAVHRHQDELTRQLRSALTDPALAALEVESYLALLGHLQCSNCEDLIASAWTRYQDKVLGYAIWAAARCPVPNIEVLLGPLLRRLGALLVRTGASASLTEHEMLILALGWAFRRGVTQESLTFILDSESCGLRPRDISLLVEGVDDPRAVEFLVRHLATGGGSNLWSGLTGIGGRTPVVKMRSKEVAEHLSQLWSKENESEKVRDYAFCLWLAVTGTRDIDRLARIEPESSFYRYAIQHRIRIRDRTVTPELVSLLRANDLYGVWWLLAPQVWCEEINRVAIDTLAGFRGRIPSDFSGGHEDLLLHFAKILIQIPVPAAEELLKENWEHLQYCSWMITAALRLGTPTCVVLARNALEKCSPEVDVFELAFSTIWDQKNPANPITLRHLENLKPYLDRMNESEILFLAWETERAVGPDERIANWIRTELVPRLPYEDQFRVHVADEMLIKALDRDCELTEYSPNPSWVFGERNGHRFVFPTRHIEIIREWLSSHRTVRGLEVAAAYLGMIGTRRDWEILNLFSIEGDPLEVQRLRTDAKFAVWSRTLS